MDRFRWLVLRKGSPTSGEYSPLRFDADSGASRGAYRCMGIQECSECCWHRLLGRQVHEHTDTWSCTSWCLRAATTAPREDSTLPLSAMISPSRVMTWFEELVSSSSSRRTSSALLENTGCRQLARVRVPPRARVSFIFFVIYLFSGR